jgi:hypothetical protein
MSEKEIVMDVREGGGRRSRKARSKRSRRSQETDGGDSGPAIVTKDEATVKPTVVGPNGPPPVVSQKGGVATPSQTTVILAPAKKKLAKVMLVPKSTVAGKVRVHPKKTFKAKRVRVTIDNTAKTLKHRRVVMGKFDAMTEDQVRSAAVAAKLSRRETVAKVPIGLLRQMLKDYQSMRL